MIMYYVLWHSQYCCHNNGFDQVVGSVSSAEISNHSLALIDWIRLGAWHELGWFLRISHGSKLKALKTILRRNNKEKFSRNGMCIPVIGGKSELVNYLKSWLRDAIQVFQFVELSCFFTNEDEKPVVPID